MLKDHLFLSFLLWHAVFCLVATLHLIVIYKSPVKNKKQADARVKIDQSIELMRHSGVIPEKWIPTIFVIVSFLMFFFTFLYLRRMVKDFIGLFKKKAQPHE